MHMGFVSMIKDHQAENFNHIVINNGLHESVGNQETLYKNIDIVKIAEASGYKNAVSFDCEKGSLDKVINLVKVILNKTGPNLIELNVGVKTRPELYRPKETTKENLTKFMNKIK